MTTPEPNARPGSAAGPGQLLHLIRSGEVRTRRELQARTGLSRSTVAARVDQLLREGLIREGGVDANLRGRPSTALVFDETRGAVLAADLGATHARAAVCDLGGRILAEHAQGFDIRQGPEASLAWLEATWRQLASSAGEPRILGVGLGVPGPVDFTSGRPENPPIMPGWHGYPVRDELVRRFGVPAFVENDANVMALGEFHAGFSGVPSFLFVKVSTGIGAGMVVGGELLRGADGGSGDIGHIRLGHPETGPVCACGARGCLAASASGGALVRRLCEAGLDATTTRDAVELARGGEPQAVALVREAGLLIGDVLATAVSLLNPRVLVVGGELVRAQDHFMSSLRERLYQRTQPLATRNLRILPSALGTRAGVIGAARLGIEELFSPEAVDRALAG